MRHKTAISGFTDCSIQNATGGLSFLPKHLWLGPYSGLVRTTSRRQNKVLNGAD